METSSLKNESFNWTCKKTWLKSAKNTLWCLLGCSIGDFGTILFFQINNYGWSTISIMILAIINGLITSIILETFILLKQMPIINAIKTALGMSFISMISMEISMNLVDWLIMGEAKINLLILPIMLLAGFLTPWPYNYWRLKKFNIDCH